MNRPPAQLYSDEIVVIVKGARDEIMQALGQTRAEILQAVEADRNHLDVLEQTLKPELRQIRLSLAWLINVFKRMGSSGPAGPPP